MGLIAYGLIALAILGALGGIGYKVRQSGFDACTVERQADEAKAAAKAETERQRQDALRAAQDKEATRRLSNEKKRAAGLMVSLEAHIKASGPAGQSPIPDSLRDDWNLANAGPKGVSTGTVPPVSPKPAPAR